MKKQNTSGRPHLQWLPQSCTCGTLPLDAVQLMDGGLTRWVTLRDAQGPEVTLPYVRGVSEGVCHILTPLGVMVSFRPHTTELTGVVYQVPVLDVMPHAWGR